MTARNGLRFEPYDRLQAAGLTIDRVNYELVYTAPLPAHRLQFPDICFCVASVNDKNIPVYRHFTEVCPILLYGKLLHLLVDQPLFFFRNVKLHLYISLSVFHFRTAFRYKGLGLSQQAFSANGYSFAVLAIYSIPPPKGGICCAFL